MSDLIITAVGDTWTNDAKPSENYGSVKWVQVQSGTRRGWLLPELPPLAGRTVLAASLVGHAGDGGVSAQTLTLRPATSKWQPGRLKVAGEPAVNASAGGTVTIGALDPGETFTLTAGLATFFQSIADGDEFYGFRLTTSAASAQKFYATDSGQPAWEFHITLSDLADQPTNLRPDGGAVTDSTPILAWGSTDIGGDVGQQAETLVEVVSPTVGVDPDDVAPDYYSGWTANLSQQWDLTGEHTLVGAGPHYWRVTTRDADGTESEPSDWAEFTVAAMPSLVLDSPTGAFGDVTPQIQAHLSSGSVKQWRAMVTGADKATVRAESGMQSGAVDWQVPAKTAKGAAVLREDDPGWGYLQVYPTGTWAEAVGQLPYRELWFPLDLDASPSVTPPSGLTLSQVGDYDARHDWTWYRSEAATGWLIRVGGVTVARLEPEDVTSAGGGWYTWRDRGEVPPMRTVNREVVALEGADASEPVISTGSHVVRGVVLLVDGIEEPIVLDETGISGATRVDARATYTTHPGEEVDIYYGPGGRVFPFQGSIGKHGVDVWATIDRIEAAKALRMPSARVVYGSRSAYGRLRDLDWTPHDDILPNNELHVVRFNHYEPGRS